MPPSIQLIDAKQEPGLRVWLENVYPFYLHDLSEFNIASYSLDASGRWQPDHLFYWFREPFCFPLIALDSGVPVGFAFVGQRPFPYMAEDRDFHLAEFFVLRSHRHSGVGRQIALQTLRRFKGRWELWVLPRNAGAISFWRSVLPEVAADDVTEALGPTGVRFAFEVSRPLPPPSPGEEGEQQDRSNKDKVVPHRPVGGSEE